MIDVNQLKASGQLFYFLGKNRHFSLNATNLIENPAGLWRSARSVKKSGKFFRLMSTSPTIFAPIPIYFFANKIENPIINSGFSIISIRFLPKIR